MEKKLFHVLLDNGHGVNTLGKFSPDKSIREYKYCRELVSAISQRLTADGYNVHLITPEDNDISLSTRANRANQYCRMYGSERCLFISVHLNAAGDDCKWHPAGGWSAWTTKGKTISDKLADHLYDAADFCLKNYKENFYIAKKAGKYSEKQNAIRTDVSDGDRDWEANFTVIYKTNCAAVLTENLFQDSEEDVRMLHRADIFNEIVNLHVKGIQDYIASL